MAHRSQHILLTIVYIRPSLPVPDQRCDLFGGSWAAPKRTGRGPAGLTGLSAPVLCVVSAVKTPGDTAARRLPDLRSRHPAMRHQDTSILPSRHPAIQPLGCRQQTPCREAVTDAGINRREPSRHPATLPVPAEARHVTAGGSRRRRGRREGMRGCLACLSQSRICRLESVESLSP